MTGLGMELMSAASLGHRPPTTSANPPAYQKIWVEYTRVTLMTPMFSAYVVVGGPPRKPEIMVDRPSPASERGNSGR